MVKIMRTTKRTMNMTITLNNMINTTRMKTITMTKITMTTIKKILIQISIAVMRMKQR